jgi:membrane-associated phospholipid phosphatase
MNRESGSQTKQVYGRVTAPGENKLSGGHPRWIVGIALWVIGVIILGVAAVIVHFHTAPWPVELSFTRSIQGPHPIPCPIPIQPRSWLEAALFDVSILNNPIPSVIGAAIWVGGLLLLRWWRQALFFVVAVASAGGLFLVLTPLVGRPRPGVKYGICIHDIYSYYSFPSGHVTHDVVCYGFLLYLTFTKPVREWRYRWVLIPLQLFFVYDLLTIGYSRVLEGDHWLFDVLGGYLTGILWLLFFIFLYRWTADRWEHHRLNKMAKQRI